MCLPSFTGFYWTSVTIVSSSVTVFYWVLYGFHCHEPCFIEFYWIWFSFIHCYYVFLGYIWLLLVKMFVKMVLPSFTWFYWTWTSVTIVSPNVTVFYLVLLGFILNLTGFYPVSSILSTFDWVWLNVNDVWANFIRYKHLWLGLKRFFFLSFFLLPFVPFRCFFLLGFLCARLISVPRYRQRDRGTSLDR